MKNKNVCKFTLHDVASELSVYCFVLETEKEIMARNYTLPNKRMILFDQGEGECFVDGVAYQFAPGTLLFCFEGEKFTLPNGDGVRYFYIDFGGARGDSLLRRFGIIPRTRKKDNLNELIPFCADSLLKASDENIDIAAELVLLYVFSRMSVVRLAQNDVLQKVIDITEENFRDPQFSISSIAKEIGYNSKYLSHFFKKQMNVPYSEYLRSVRFKYAVSLFKMGLVSVKNVAFLSGFVDSLYFSKTFKKAIGVSPKDFIKNLSDESSEL